MTEKKSELKLAMGSLGAIITMVLAALAAAAQALVDTGMLVDKPAYLAIAMAVIAATGAMGAARVSSAYSNSRAAVKVARERGIETGGPGNPTIAAPKD